MTIKRKVSLSLFLGLLQKLQDMECTEIIQLIYEEKKINKEKRLKKCSLACYNLLKIVLGIHLLFSLTL